MECVVVGIGGDFVADVVAILQRLSWTVRTFVSNVDGDPNPQNVDPVVGSSDLSPGLLALPCVIGVVTPRHRQAATESARRLGFTAFPALVDPSAVVAHDATLGEGVILNAGAVIAARSEIRAFAVVNRLSSVGHHATVGEYGFIGPGVTVCGGAKIGNRAFIGAAATLLPGATVADRKTISAGSLVKAS